MTCIAIIIAAVFIHGAGTLDAETLTCSTWQGTRTYQGPGGYVSHESAWSGITTGDDNRGTGGPRRIGTASGDDDDQTAL